jgi:transposase
MSEIGFDLSSFPTKKHISSWLALSPNQKITGGKVKSSHTPKRKNRVSEALRNSANVIGNMRNNPLSDFFHRVAYKKGRAHAITATARKLGVIIYIMLTRKQQYMPLGNEQYKKQIRLQKIKRMQKLIVKLGITKNEIKLVA